jgi:orotate phosphoribosyltransferase
MTGHWERLRDRLESLCLIEGDFVLTTGLRSSFYFDCKRATLDGECLSLIADEFLDRITTLPEAPAAIGGLTMGADFIVAGVIQRAHERGVRMSGSIVRKEPKKHGTRSKVENELPRGTSIVVVDDVFTTGTSTATACRELLAEGYRVVGIVGLVDREQGGAENLGREFGCPVLSVFRKRDFPALNEPPRTRARA